jgi:hypothetical protein
MFRRIASSLPGMDGTPEPIKEDREFISERSTHMQ